MDTVSKRGVPYKLLTLFYAVGMVPLLCGFDLAFISKFTTTNSLIYKVLVCCALFAFASKSGDVLERASLKIKPRTAKIVAVAAIVVLCALSSSLLMNMSYYVTLFLVGLVVLTSVYSKTYAKHVTIENDLLVDFTSKHE